MNKFVFCAMLTSIIMFATSCSSPVSNNAPDSQNPVVAADTIPPTVASVTPADGTADIAIIIAITATFSEAIDKTTVINTSGFTFNQQ